MVEQQLRNFAPGCKKRVPIKIQKSSQKENMAPATIFNNNTEPSSVTARSQDPADCAKRLNKLQIMEAGNQTDIL